MSLRIGINKVPNDRGTRHPRRYFAFEVNVYLTRRVFRNARYFAYISIFTGAAFGQSLTALSCSPTSIADGASTSCVASISSAASLTGFPIKLSTTATGLAVPAQVAVGWGRTSVTFTITASTSAPAQSAVITAIAGTVSKAAGLTITTTATYTVSTLTCTPAKLIPGQSASCVAYLSAQAPSGGLVATISSTSANLATPRSASIAAGLNGFKFTATAGSQCSSIESVTVSAALPSGGRSVIETIDPSPKFYFKGSNSEVTLMANGAAVYPAVTPAGWAGTLNRTGAGYVAFDPVNGSDGIAFHQSGAQNTNSAFINFNGSAIGNVFNSASEISFVLNSAYSYAERRSLPSLNMRTAFEVFDDSRSRYIFDTYTNSYGQLLFGYGAQGFSGTYVVPAGMEDQLFGKGVSVQVKITWTSNTVSLFLNGTRVSTITFQPVNPYWSYRSAFTIGSRSVRLSGGGYYASDDTIADLMIR